MRCKWCKSVNRFVILIRIINWKMFRIIHTAGRRVENEEDHDDECATDLLLLSLSFITIVIIGAFCMFLYHCLLLLFKSVKYIWVRARCCGSECRQKNEECVERRAHASSQQMWRFPSTAQVISLFIPRCKAIMIGMFNTYFIRQQISPRCLQHNRVLWLL